jgi:hypothetical protein
VGLFLPPSFGIRERSDSSVTDLALGNALCPKEDTRCTWRKETVAFGYPRERLFEHGLRDMRRL